MEKIHRRDFAEPDRAAVQEEVIRAVEANPEPFIEAYNANPNNFGGRYVCADGFKDTFEQYRHSPEARNRYNAVVHNAAAVLSSEQFSRALRDDAEPHRNEVLFLTGVPGAGKTTAVLSRGLPPNTRVIFEGQLSRPEPSMGKIQAALDAGMNPRIVVVHVTPEVALRRTFTRFVEYGRGASLAVMADIQAGLPAGLSKIYDHFGPAIDLTVLDNRVPGQHKELHGWQHIKQLSQEGNHERITQRLRAELDRHRDEGRISDACYRQAKGDAPLAIAAAVVQRRDREHQQGVDERAVSERAGQANQLGDRAMAAPGRPARAIAFEQLSQAESLERHPELMGAYRQLEAKRIEGAQQFPRDVAAQAAHLEAARGQIQSRLDDGRIPPPPPAAPGRPTQERER